MIITKINQQQRQRDRVSLFIDNQFWTGMGKELFTELQLHSGQELTIEQVREIEARVVEDSALNYALNRLSIVMTSEETLREKLAERDYGPQVIDQVINRCRELALLNDQLMAENLAAEAQRSHRGPHWLARKLQQKGLSKQQDVLDSFSAADQQLAADQALQDLIGEALLDRRQQQKMIRTLVRRGFSAAEAQQAVAKKQLSAEQEREIHGVEQAHQDLNKKYPQGLTANKHSQAYAFLLRRGYLPDIASEALRLARD